MGSSPSLSLGRKALYGAYLDLLKAKPLWQSDRDAARRYVIQACADTMHASRVSVWWFNESRDRIFCQETYKDKEFISDPSLTIPVAEHPAYFEAIASSRVLPVENVSEHPATKSVSNLYFEPLDIQSLLDVSISQAGVITGVLCIEQTQSRYWSLAEQDFAIALADILSQVSMVSALSQTQERYHKVFNATNDAILLMHDRRLVDCNEAALKMFGCSKEEYYRQSATRFWPEYQPDGTTSRDKAAMYFQRSADSGRSLRFEWRHRHFNGDEFDTEVDLNQILLNHEPHFIICIRDITERKAAEHHIQGLLAMQQAIFDGANYSIISTDLKGRIVSFNRAAQSLLGYRAEEVIHLATPMLFHDSNEINWRAIELSEQLNQPIDDGFSVFTALAQNGQTEEREWTYISKNGDRIPVSLSVTALRQGGNDITGFLCIASDITLRKKATEALLQSQKEMEFRTYHDDLTGLPNRIHLHSDAITCIPKIKLTGGKLAMLLIDLDRFKEVNDTLGHAFGDELIKGISHRLNILLTDLGATLYRLGGDEFAVLIPHIIDTKEVDQLIEEINKTLRESISIGDEIHIEISGSIGIAVYPDNGEDSHSLLRCADVAMYKAKSNSSGSMYYQPEEDSHSTRRLAMMSELGNAIRSNQLILHYQPRIAIAKQVCIGCEALVRWQHPKLGMIPPTEFIPLAEVSDQIQPLGYWVLETALKQARAWIDKGLNQVVSINLSTRNLMDTTFPDTIFRMLEDYKVPPKYLEVEITESTLIDDPEKALQVIDRIHSLGVRFAIDDFGTGYSSLSYLKRLPIDTLKIDRSFIKDMLTDEQDAVIVRSTLSLAHSFGLEVVAEGVEDSATLTALKALQCEQVQGYYFSRPLPATDFEQWLKDFN